MKTRKQIVEQTRNEVVKQYTAKLQILMERINKLTKDYDIEKQKRIEFSGFGSIMEIWMKLFTAK